VNLKLEDRSYAGLWSSENSPTKLSEKGFEQRSEHGFGRYEEGKGAEKSRLGVPQSCAIDSSEAFRTVSLGTSVNKGER
jgi:hypothetical protein